MARPKKKNADYHSHDKDMRNDNRIKSVRRKYGHLGYSIWNMLLEHLTDCDNFIYKYDALNIELLAGDFDIDPDKLTEILDYFTTLKLIQKENGLIYCEKHIERFSGLISKRQRQTSNKELSTSKTINIEDKDVEKPQSKVKESKLNNSIEVRKAEFKNSLQPFLEKYGKDLLNDFFGYWTEHGERDRKMRFEKQKSFGLSRRLATWLKNQKTFEKEKNVAPKKENAGIALQRRYGLTN